MVASLYRLSSQAGCSEPRRASTRGREKRPARSGCPGRERCERGWNTLHSPHPTTRAKAQPLGSHFALSTAPQCNQVLLTKFVLKPKRKQCPMFPGSSAPGTHVGTFGALRAEAHTLWGCEPAPGGWVAWACSCRYLVLDRLSGCRGSSSYPSGGGEPQC